MGRLRWRKVSSHLDELTARGHNTRGVKMEEQSVDVVNSEEGHTDAPGNDAPQSFDDWLGDQPEAIKALYASHTDGLRSALRKERDDNKSLTKQLKDLGSKLEDGSEARKALDEITQKLEGESSRADFYEEAVGVGVADLKLAWLAVKSEPELTNRGKVDFDKMRSLHPQLFAQAQPIPRGNAGVGAVSLQTSEDMNTRIRKAAGL